MRFFNILLPLCLAAIFFSSTQAKAATIQVNTFADELNNDGDCSLREAIQAANSNTAVDQCVKGDIGTDTILLQPTLDEASIYALTLGNTDPDPKSEDLNQEGDLDILEDLNLEGSDPAHRSVLDAEALEDFVSSSNPGERVLQIFGTGATLKNLVLRGGNGRDGGGLYNGASDLVLVENCVISNNFSDGGGGGILNNGILEIHDSHITRNDTNGSGGGIGHAGRLLVSRTSIDNNHSLLVGGGISSDIGSVTLSNSTISQNQSESDGGGVYAAGKSEWTLSNVTLAFNTATGKGSGLITSGLAAVFIEKSIVSENAGGKNCNLEDNVALFLGSLGYNIENGATCEFSKTNDLNDDPLLDSNLQDNGGPTPTHALLAGSPAIDQLLNCRGTPTDQRGFARPVDGDAEPGALCDMGAYEFGAVAPPPEEPGPGPGPEPCRDPEGCEEAPQAEDCDNELDDDGNGQIDCDDAACAQLAACRDGLVSGTGCQLSPLAGPAEVNMAPWATLATLGLGLWIRGRKTKA